MKKNDWVRKLTSRKFWASIATFVSMMIIACGGTENQSTQVTALIMAGASIIAYVIAEGFADATYTDDNADNKASENTEK